MKEAQRKKELELSEKIKLADEKLASVTKLEQDNTNLKAALAIASKDVERLKADKTTLTEKINQMAGKKNELEGFLGGLAKKLFLMLEGNLLHSTNSPNCYVPIRLFS